MKKILAMTLALTLAFGTVALPAVESGITFSTGISASAAEMLDGDFKYIIQDDNTVAITGYTGAENDVVIPDEIDGINVTCIKSRAFCSEINCQNIKNITLSKNIKKIEELAFLGCDNLEKFVVDENNNYFCIQKNALFSKDKTELICYPALAGRRLNDIYTVPDSVNKIYGGAFYYCGLNGYGGIKQIIISDSVASIGKRAFYRCESLTEVNIPEGITKIEDGTFEWCRNLQNIELPDSIEEIGEYVFWMCDNLKEVTLPPKITLLKKGLFGSCRNLSKLTIPTNVTYIGDECFWACQKLKELSIPDSVSYIGQEAFYKSAIREINLPRNLTKINEYTFYDCINLTKIVIPNNVTEIGNYAFYNCTNLTDITLPKSITSMGTDSVGFCDDADNNNKVEGLVIKCHSGTLAEAYAMSNGISYEPHDYTHNVKKEVTCTENGIDELSCPCCDTFESIIPSKGHNLIKVETVDPNYDADGYTVYKCTECDYEEKQDITAKLTDYQYNDLDDGTVEITGYSGNGGDIVIPSSIDYKKVSSIGKSAFAYTSNIESVTIPETVTNISDNVFMCCFYLKNVTIPNSVLKIGGSVFWGCDKLNSINVASDNPSYTSVDGVLFNKDKTTLIQYPVGCSYESYIIPEGVKNVDAAFVNASYLEYVKIPNTVETIGVMAFKNCSNLTSVTFPESVTEIGLQAYYGCTSLQNVQFTNKLQTIGIQAFANCTNLKDVVIPKYVTSIGSYAFGFYRQSSSDSFQKIEDFDIICHQGSAAHTYCLNNSITSFVHDFYFSDVTKQPTCLDTGIRTYNCYCGDTYTEVIPALGHTFGEWVTTNPATCTTDGEEQRVCTVCGETETRTIKATGHTFGEWKVTKPATCTEDGEEQRKCSCDETETRSIKATGHKYSEEWTIDKQPTCTEKGSKSHHCTACGDKKDVTEIPATGHTFGDWEVTKPATCTEDGEEQRKCSCGEMETRTIEATGHKYSEEWTIDKQPTCTEKGSKSHHCTVCGDKKDITEIPATGHTFGEWTVTKSATCTEDGEEQRKCSVCGETETRTIEATGHKYSEIWTIDVPATCTTLGLKSHHCTECDEKSDVTEIPALGHDFGEWKETNPATCTEDGEEQRKCSVCGETETETIEATGHKYTTKVVKPTCTAKGYTLHTCSACGKSYKDTYTKALGHKYIKVKVVKPTLKSKGYTLYKCSRCGATVKKNFVPALVSISKAKVTGIKNVYYNGKQIKPSIKVVLGKTPLKKGRDYTVYYGKNKIGRAVVKIVGKGKYAGSVTKYFRILPRKTAVVVKSTVRGKISTVVIKRPEATRYQIQLSTNSKFIGAKTYTVKLSKATLKGVSNKVYYVRVRTVNGKYASEWSAIKKVKVK